MAKTVAPLLSWDARGQIAKTQVYSSWKGRPLVRRYVVPANPDTAAQQETRNTFKWLNSVWPYMPAGAIGAWSLYAQINRFNDRNGWIKQNLSSLLSQSDLSNLLLSPAANGGLVAASTTITPGVGQVQVDLTAPTLPSGWTVTQAVAAVIADQDPQSGTAYEVFSDVDATAPYSITISGLAAGDYLVQGWFEYQRSDGSQAFGQATGSIETVT